MMLLTDHEREFLAAFIYEATTDPFHGPATHELHRRNVYYNDLSHLFPLANLKRQKRTAYMACVRRTTRRGKAEVYPMPLWERLPELKVPLRSQDDHAPLDLQGLVTKCYLNGAYEGTLDYAADPDPPLLGADKEWADSRLRETGWPRKKPPRRKGERKSS